MSHAFEGLTAMEGWYANATDRYGNILVENLFQYELSSIRRSGDYYLESFTAEDGEGNFGTFFNVYDLDLKLLKVLDYEKDAEELESLQQTEYSDIYLTTEYDIDPENPRKYRISAGEDVYADVMFEGSTLYVGGQAVYSTDRYIWYDAFEDGTVIWKVGRKNS